MAISGLDVISRWVWRLFTVTSQDKFLELWKHYGKWEEMVPTRGYIFWSDRSQFGPVATSFLLVFYFAEWKGNWTIAVLISMQPDQSLQLVVGPVQLWSFLWFWTGPWITIVVVETMKRGWGHVDGCYCVVIIVLWSSHVKEEGEEGEDEMWARCCCCCYIWRREGEKSEDEAWVRHCHHCIVVVVTCGWGWGMGKGPLLFSCVEGGREGEVDMKTHATGTGMNVDWQGCTCTHTHMVPVTWPTWVICTHGIPYQRYSTYTMEVYSIGNREMELNNRNRCKMLRLHTSCLECRTVAQVHRISGENATKP